MAAHESPRTTKLYDRTDEGEADAGRGREDQALTTFYLISVQHLLIIINHYCTASFA
jgi:hypothetical protein